MDKKDEVRELFDVADGFHPALMEQYANFNADDWVVDDNNIDELNAFITEWCGIAQVIYDKYHAIWIGMRDDCIKKYQAFLDGLAPKAEVDEMVTICNEKCEIIHDKIEEMIGSLTKFHSMRVEFWDRIEAEAAHNAAAA